MARLTFAECQDLVETATKPPETDEEIAKALLTMDVTPHYLEGLRQLREGIKSLEDAFTPCKPDCEDEACLGKPQHQSMVYSTIHPPFLDVEAAVKSLKNEMAHFLYKMFSCECVGCDIKRKTNAAPFN
jgi:hypothetical protein